MIRSSRWAFCAHLYLSTFCANNVRRVTAHQLGEQSPTLPVCSTTLAAPNLGDR